MRDHRAVATLLAVAAAAPLIVVGAGGQASEILDVIEAINFQQPTFDVLGVVDDDPTASAHRMKERGIGLLGTLDEVVDRDVLLVLAVGYPKPRRAAAERLLGAGGRFATLVHPAASLGTGVTVGEGAVVFGGVWCSPLVTVGRFTYLSYGVLVGHDSVVGDYASLFPNCVVGGNVKVGEEVLIGANASILQDLHVGAQSTIGAGSTVMRDIPESVTAIGVPAKVFSSVRGARGPDG